MVRMKALKERIEKCMIGYSVDNSKVKYKQVFGVYTDDSDKGSELQIPFFYEIMIFHDIKNTIDTLMVKQALNCSAVPRLEFSLELASTAICNLTNSFFFLIHFCSM